MNSLDGKVALMTASGQGIGLATAKAFANAGAYVIATDINEKTLSNLSDDVSETHVLDVTDKNAIATLVSKIKEPDILFNCAGTVHDGTIIDGNREISNEDRENRLNRCYRPYHNEITRLISYQNDPILISIHSFTPKLKNGFNRPWHVGILYSKDRRFAQPLLNYFNNLDDVNCGDNEPYRGDLVGDTMFRHALNGDRLHVLIEVRNDLICSASDQMIWATKLAQAINSVKKEIDQ